MILAFNIFLMAVVFSAVVGTLAWAILSSRPARQVRLVRSPVRPPAYRQRARDVAWLERAEAQPE